MSVNKAQLAAGRQQGIACPFDLDAGDRNFAEIPGALGLLVTADNPVLFQTVQMSHTRNLKILERHQDPQMCHRWGKPGATWGPLPGPSLLQGCPGSKPDMVDALRGREGRTPDKFKSNGHFGA